MKQLLAALMLMTFITGPVAEARNILTNVPKQAKVPKAPKRTKAKPMDSQDPSTDLCDEAVIYHYFTLCYLYDICIAPCTTDEE